MQDHRSITQTEIEMAATALKNVNSGDRLIASLYFYEGLTMEEISVILEREMSEVHQSLNNVFATLMPMPDTAEAHRSRTAAAHIL